MRSMSGIAAALAVLTCTAVVAAGMTRDEYKAARKRIASEYEVERQQCGAHLGHATELCVTRARGAQKVAQAELEATYKPSPRTNYDAAIARANSVFATAKKECEVQKGDARKGCEKDASAARERARAAATAARKASTAEAAPPKQ